jgi:F-type H+-transporting ATPase subunit epsilon
VTPEAVEFHGEVTSVIAPGTEGYLGVLPGHTPLVTSLRPGKLSVDSAAGRRDFEIGAGYMEVTPESVIIITEKVTSKTGEA